MTDWCWYGHLQPGDVRPRPETGGLGVMVGTVVTPSASIAVGKFLTVNPTSVFGPEVEGGAGIVTTTSSALVSVYLVGPHVPSQGDRLVCRSVGFRWVADRGGKSTTAGGIVIPGCPCPGGSAGGTPTSLFMHVQNPQYNLRNIQPATLVYGPSPALYRPLGVAGNNHFSVEFFTDVASGDSFQYVFRCEGGLYAVRKVFPASTPNGGSPYLSDVLYRWAIGFPGNNCDTAARRFQLTVGTIYAGGTPATVATVDTNGPA